MGLVSLLDIYYGILGDIQCNHIVFPLRLPAAKYEWRTF